MGQFCLCVEGIAPRLSDVQRNDKSDFSGRFSLYNNDDD